ncbi:YL1 nuclear protein-domain-containing protein [Fusarium solani]|uniref:YL1 nuclear protein-domain-containing protein n=1 Tax=Fusarium solani TaxID=169388 RepID=A0A9P9HPA0_FUSSL|nr:YL1 nuclear protein-domain-containing protein [Fusarium solani]KAH7260079.1 YL1 nuclear protein-domain-containing protein [Fusarium solani]
METESKPSEMGTPRSSSLSSLSDSDSDSETAKNLQRRSNDSDSQINNEDKIEWLATTRKRRSTAGNRMKSMLANEEPDSDLELLFAEDENDQGFSDADENASDVHMDSSSDDEDNDNNDDDLEGEKELERQAKERRAAQRKRKAQEAIPAKFRKKVRIDPTTKTPAAPTRPPPRPKKKSERTSWLPSPADLPTRASSRQTTRLSKEQLHQQMVEREARRLKQVAQMQKKAARLEAMKKPPMTQEERLREAAIVEKRNSKSLNRWEVAEKQREEERRAKLAALHQRTLKGPVITFWSGIGEWMGRHMVIEEPAKEKRKRGEKAKGKDKDKSKGQDKTPAGEEKKDGNQDRTPAANDASSKAKDEELQPAQQQPSTTPSEPAAASGAKEAEPNATPKVGDAVTKPADPPSTAPKTTSPTLKTEEPVRSMAMPPPPPPSGLAILAPQPPSSTPTPPPPSPLAPPTSGLAAPSPLPATAPPDTTQQSIMTPPSGLARPPEPKPSGVLAAPILAPPLGISVNGAVPPMMGFGNPKSNVLAPPNTSQGVVPPTLSAVAPPHPSISPPVTASPAPKPPPAPATSSSTTDAAPKDILPQPASKPSDLPAKTPNTDPSAAPNPPSAEPQPPQPSTGARNAMVFQNFDNNALKDRTIQTQIIFGRKMNKLPKPSPAPLCVITNHPARYRDPRTGLPYYNAYAYREIQRLIRNEYRWSCALNAWVGSGTYAARGVPERFLNPNKKGPEKKEPATGDETKGEAAKATDVAPVPKGPDGTTGTPVPENKVNAVKDEPKPSPTPQPDTAKATAQVNTAAPGNLAQPPTAGPSTSTSAPAPAPAPASAPVLTAPTFAPPTSAAAPAPQPQLQAPANPPPTAVGTAPTPAQEAK